MKIQLMTFSGDSTHAVIRKMNEWISTRTHLVVPINVHEEMVDGGRKLLSLWYREG